MEARERLRSSVPVAPARRSASALFELGWHVAAVAGRAPDAAVDARPRRRASARRRRSSPMRGAARRSCSSRRPTARSQRRRARSVPRSNRTRSSLHLAGSIGLDAFDGLRELRPDVRVGALHPLQSFPSASAGIERVRGSWAAVAGDPQTAELAAALGMRPFDLADAERALYHAAAVVASNHLVGLLGQVERLAASGGVPFEAFAPLVRSSVANAFNVGPGPGAHRAGQPRRSRDRRGAPARRSIPASATRTGRWRARSRGSPAGATARSTGCSATSATHRRGTRDRRRRAAR